MQDVGNGTDASPGDKKDPTKQYAPEQVSEGSLPSSTASSIFRLPFQSIEKVLEDDLNAGLAGCEIRYCMDGTEFASHSPLLVVQHSLNLLLGTWVLVQKGNIEWLPVEASGGNQTRISSENSTIRSSQDESENCIHFSIGIESIHGKKEVGSAMITRRIRSVGTAFRMREQC